MYLVNNICILIGVFRPFTYKIINDIVRLIPNITVFIHFIICILWFYFNILHYFISIIHFHENVSPVALFHWLQYTLTSNISPLSNKSLLLYIQCRYLITKYCQFLFSNLYNIAVIHIHLSKCCKSSNALLVFSLKSRYFRSVKENKRFYTP